eukprot:CAMPEP_0118937742 /NCGR_PEP_ID=MMETSP1169-20130426/23654_1 /TAXON_ID=36882 /ORGANISM="Pyramimonas obovata, Strain CCMP722" /LENGTH=88 /DNA_ID=CAMNT_0006881473 /DNA_START=205 /DNA_END=471 /DNA_ORIENTATION=+
MAFYQRLHQLSCALDQNEQVAAAGRINDTNLDKTKQRNMVDSPSHAHVLRSESLKSLSQVNSLSQLEKLTSSSTCHAPDSISRWLDSQ